jgi:hypothetical protein
LAEDAAQMAMEALLRKHPEEFPVHPDVPDDTVPSKKRIMQYCKPILRQRVFETGKKGRWLPLTRWRWKLAPKECVWQRGDSTLSVEEIQRLIAEEEVASSSGQGPNVPSQDKASICAEWIGISLCVTTNHWLAAGADSTVRVGWIDRNHTVRGAGEGRAALWLTSSNQQPPDRGDKLNLTRTHIEAWKVRADVTFPEQKPQVLLGQDLSAATAPGISIDQDVLHRAIQKLTEAERILVRWYRKELTREEVEKHLDYEKSQLYVKRTAAKNRLLKILAEMMVEKGA